MNPTKRYTYLKVNLIKHPTSMSDPSHEIVKVNPIKHPTSMNDPPHEIVNMRTKIRNFQFNGNVLRSNQG